MVEQGVRHLAFDIDEQNIDLLHLAHGISAIDFAAEDKRTIHAIGEHMVKGPLYGIGRGGDMVATSRLGLNFVLKFPYEDSSSGLKPRFSKRIEYGYHLGKDYLGGILVPSIDVPLICLDENGDQIVYIAIAQEKVLTVEEYLRKLDGERRILEEERLRKEFVELTVGMWQRGILDRDPNWEENYGILIYERAPSSGFPMEWGAHYKRGGLVLIDVGDLSDDPDDFPEYEGIPRKHLYDASLRSLFSLSNFREYFGTVLDECTPTPAVLVSEP